MHIRRAQLGRDGRLVIPATLRQELGLRPGDTVVIESDGDSLLLTGDERTFRGVSAPLVSDRAYGG